MRYHLLREIKTGRRFYAEYSEIAGEWYEMGTGEAHQNCEVEFVRPEPEDKDALDEARKYADVRLSENDPKLYDSKHTRHRKMGQVCFAGYEIEQAYYDGIMSERARMSGLRFTPILRLLGMIGKWTKAADSYTAKLADSLEKHGFAADAKCVREHLRARRGKPVARATQDATDAEKVTIKAE